MLVTMLDIGYDCLCGGMIFVCVDSSANSSRYRSSVSSCDESRLYPTYIANFLDYVSTNTVAASTRRSKDTKILEKRSPMSII